MGGESRTARTEIFAIRPAPLVRFIPKLTPSKFYRALSSDGLRKEGRYGEIVHGSLRDRRNSGASKCRIAELLSFLVLSFRVLPCLVLSRPRGPMLTIEGDPSLSCLVLSCRRAAGKYYILAFLENKIEEGGAAGNK